MIKSKTKIEEQLRKKTNPELVKTIILAKKNTAWIEVATRLTSPTKIRKNVNLSQLNNSQGEILVVPGKVLGDGEITKKIKVVALGFSRTAEEKLKKAGCLTKLIIDEIQENKNAKGVVIL